MVVSKNESNYLAYLLIVIAMLFWGMSYIWIKIAYEFLGPLSTVFLRLFFSLLLILIIALIFGIRILPHKEDIPAFMLLAFFEPFAYFMGESLGLQRVTSSVASIMIGTIPLFIPLFAFLILKDKITRNNIIGLLISFIGLLVLILKKDLSFQASPSGILLMLVAVFAGALYTIQLKKLSTKYKVGTIIINMQIFGLIYFAPFFLYYEWNDFIHTEITMELIVAIAQLVVFASLGALYFFIYSVDKIGVTRTSLFTNLIPVVTVIAAWIALPNEEINLKLIIGVVIILTGVYIGNYAKKEKI